MSHGSSMNRKILNLGLVLAAMALTTGCRHRSSPREPERPQLTCETHVYCREVTIYPEIPDARPGTRESPAPITSVYTGRSYEISIYLPASYYDSDQAFPIIYALDGESAFDVFADQIDRQQKDVVLASIHNHSESTRNLDYLYYDGTGNESGGADFYTYLVAELMPYVEGRYRIDAGRRALHGHSHGGNFTAYSIFEDAIGFGAFNTFIASEPTLWINEGPLLDSQNLLRATVDELDINVYLGSGLPGNPLNPNPDATEALFDYFTSSSFENLRIQYYSYDLGHGAMALPFFTDVLDAHY